METVNISTFKAMCLSLLEKVKQTRQPLLVLKRGEPIAQILPPPPPEMKESWLGSFASTGQITGDIVSPAVEDDDWEVLKSYLANMQGNDAATMLERLRDSESKTDRKVWNALYWRVDKWMGAYFARKPLSQNEESLDLSHFEVGRARWIAFLCRTYPERDDPGWNSADLRYIFQKIAAAEKPDTRYQTRRGEVESE